MFQYWFPHILLSGEWGLTVGVCCVFVCITSVQPFMSHIVSSACPLTLVLFGLLQVETRLYKSVSTKTESGRVHLHTACLCSLAVWPREFRLHQHRALQGPAGHPWIWTRPAQTGSPAGACWWQRWWKDLLPGLCQPGKVNMCALACWKGFRSSNGKSVCDLQPRPSTKSPHTQYSHFFFLPFLSNCHIKPQNP